MGFNLKTAGTSFRKNHLKKYVGMESEKYPKKVGMTSHYFDKLPSLHFPDHTHTTIPCIQSHMHQTPQDTQTHTGFYSSQHHALETQYSLQHTTIAMFISMNHNTHHNPTPAIFTANQV